MGAVPVLGAELRPLGAAPELPAAPVAAGAAPAGAFDVPAEGAPSVFVDRGLGLGLGLVFGEAVPDGAGVAGREAVGDGFAVGVGVVLGVAEAPPGQTGVP